MSLLDNAMESFIIMNKVSVPDGYGGRNEVWTEGVKIQAAMVLDSSIQAKVAMSQGVTGVYTLTTRKNINLKYHEVLRRVRDGKIFRVTSDGDDKRTPDSASLNMRQVSCEEWELTEDG